MASRDKNPLRPPATTPDGQENIMISAAVKLAQKQLEDGTASAAVITHYLKLGSSENRLQQEKLRNENLMLEAKAAALAGAGATAILYEEALNSFRKYSGADQGESDADQDL